MIGKIIAIDINKVEVEFSNNYDSDIIDKYVLFSDKHSIIGQITRFVEGKLFIDLLGEFTDNVFIPGVINKPSLTANIRFLNDNEVKLLISGNVVNSFNLGKMINYSNVPIDIDIDNLFSGHFSIFGNTGSGKSTTIAKIIQNIFYNANKKPYNANIVLFDVYDEYSNAFKEINNITKDLYVKSYTSNFNDNKNIIKIPPWFLGIDELALLLGAESEQELYIIEKALKFVNLLISNSSTSKYKNSIIAKAIIDILSSGKSLVQSRDQIISILSIYHTPSLNLETKIVVPGLTRTLRQCLNLDATGKMNEIKLVTEVLTSYVLSDVKLELPKDSIQYTLADLSTALTFALIEEGVFNNNAIFERYNVMKLRLDNLINSSNVKYFTYENYITKEQFVKNMLMIDGRKAQLLHFNINSLNDRFAKVMVKIFSKLFFDFSVNQKIRASFPIHIVIEEAHRYIVNDNDVNVLGYNIFDRIAKEGRKYGVLLGLISQRPCELSETTLSQCSNYLIFKLIHPKDLEYIRNSVPNINEEIIKKLKSLRPGLFIMFGTCVNLPIISKMELPNPTPISNNAIVSKSWYTNSNLTYDERIDDMY